MSPFPGGYLTQDEADALTTPTSPRRPGGEAEAMRDALVGLVGAALNEMAAKGLPLEWGRDSALGRAAAVLGLPNDETEHQARELSALLDEALPLPAGDTLSTGGEDAREQALEEAANVADRRVSSNLAQRDAAHSDLSRRIHEHRADEAIALADRIRSLKATAPTVPLSTGGWKPIETAPKDGAIVMLYWPTLSITKYPAVGTNHDDGCGWELISDRDYGEVFPTHWMPMPLLPEPPPGE